MSPRRWRLVLYVTPSGQMPVQDQFLDRLADSDPDRYAYFFETLCPRIEAFGPGVGAPHFKRLSSTPFSEIRWDGKDRAHYRIYCSIEAGNKLVLYHGVAKRWRRFEPADREICRARYDDYHSPNYRERLARARTRQ